MNLNISWKKVVIYTKEVTKHFRDYAGTNFSIIPIMYFASKLRLILIVHDSLSFSFFAWIFSNSLIITHTRYEIGLLIDCTFRMSCLIMQVNYPLKWWFKFR